MRVGSLNISDHSRDSAGLRYVYPVVSRRACGVSVGVNLNVNNACNWRCIYCQVPGLSRGGPLPLDMALLERELRGFLDELLHGDFMQQWVPEEMRRINDIALSGNGEPTSAEEFADVVELVCGLKEELQLPQEIKLVLITNGSLMQRESVQRGLRQMAQCNGEVWFKLDRASEQGMLQVNDTRISLESVRRNLQVTIACCPNTWLQTCWFSVDGQAPVKRDEDDFLEFVTGMIQGGARPAGMMLYSLARPSLQPEAQHLGALPAAELELFAERIRQLGVDVRVSG